MIITANATGTLPAILPSIKSAGRSPASPPKTGSKHVNQQGREPLGACNAKPHEKPQAEATRRCYETFEVRMGKHTLKRWEDTEETSLVDFISNLLSGSLTLVLDKHRLPNYQHPDCRQEDPSRIQSSVAEEMVLREPQFGEKGKTSAFVLSDQTQMQPKT